MEIDKKIAPVRAPEEPIHGGIERERLGGGRSTEKPPAQQARAKTQRKEKPIKARVLIYPQAPKQSTEKR